MEINRNCFYNNDKFTGKKVIVDERTGDLSMQAAEFLMLAGRPVKIDDYQNITNSEDHQPEGYVSLYIDVPECYRPEVNKVIAAGWKSINNLIDDDYEWPVEAAILITTYAMKRETELITGVKLNYPELEAN